MKPSGILLIATFSSVCCVAHGWSPNSSNTFKYFIQHEGRDKADELLLFYKESLERLEASTSGRSKFLEDVGTYMSKADDLYKEYQSGQLPQDFPQELGVLDTDHPTYLSIVFANILKESDELHGKNSISSDIRNILSRNGAFERHKSDLENFISMLDKIHNHFIRQAKLLDLLERWRMNRRPGDNQLKEIIHKEKDPFLGEFERFTFFLAQDRYLC